MFKENKINNDKVKNTWATVGFIIGIVSIFFAFIGTVPLSGLVINSIGIYKSGKVGGKGKWMAIIGLVLSIVFTFVYLNRYGYI